jgi:hypothetical protein
MNSQTLKNPKEAKNSEEAQKIIANKIKSLPVKSKPQGPVK